MIEEGSLEETPESKGQKMFELQIEGWFRSQISEHEDRSQISEHEDEGFLKSWLQSLSQNIQKFFNKIIPITDFNLSKLSLIVKQYIVFRESQYKNCLASALRVCLQEFDNNEKFPSLRLEVKTWITEELGKNTDKLGEDTEGNNSQKKAGLQHKAQDKTSQEVKIPLPF